MRGRLAASALVLGLLAPIRSASAQEIAPSGRMPAWELSLYKTLTYESAANLADLALSVALIGGTALGSGFLTLNTTSSIATYYAHEYAWAVFGPAPAEKTGQTIAAKTALYRIVSTARNVAIGFAFGGTAGAVGAYAASVAVVHTGLYVANEYAWDVGEASR